MLSTVYSFHLAQKDGFIGMSVSGGPFGNHKTEELVLVEENDEAMFATGGIAEPARMEQLISLHLYGGGGFPMNGGLKPM